MVSDHPICSWSVITSEMHAGRILCMCVRLHFALTFHPVVWVQIQHLYVTLGGKAGGAGRVVLADLKKDFEQHHKYSGKV